MVKLITKVLLGALSLLIVSYLLPGVTVEGIYTAIVAAVILGLLNLIVRPILVVLTLPITIVTLGLFMFVINAGLFFFAASFIENFTVDSFLAALIGSFAVSIVNAICSKLIS